jgi:hypothetical protein
MSLRAILITAFVTSLLGCAADKGEEEDPLGDDGKADSFGTPTSHGALVFGTPNKASITTAAKFHAWTFTLTGSAKVSLKTQISKNLDTVMYLYRRDVGSTGSFGAYIKKNDDHGGDIWSQIDLTGQRGEYRVVVKAFKAAQLGDFSVLGSCTGAGCPAAGTCDANKWDALPASPTKISATCATELLDAYTTRSASTSNVSVTESKVCTLDALGKRAVDLYRAYWDDVEGWDQFKSGEQDIDLDVSTSKRGALTEVTVDAPFDEDSMTFTFGSNQRLLTLYQDNQSPDARVFCDQAGTIAAPDPSCIEWMQAALPHATAETTGTKSATCSNATTALPPLVGDPVCEFTSKFGLSSTTSVSAKYRTWRSDAGLLGAEVTLTASGHTATYVLGTTFQDTTQLFATRSGTTIDLTCREL